MIRNALLCLAVLAIVLLHPAPSAAQDNAAEPECIKGTVAKVEETALYLQGTTFHDESLGKRDAMVLLDKDTKYFDGTKKINRAALQPGNIVLVYCKMAGRDRKATLVRVIGGKKL
jgi:hypothetical protein